MKHLIVIPTLGSSPFLAAAVASAGELGSGWRIMLVAPAPMVEELRQRFPGAEVRAETGSGLYAAVNDGVRACSAWAWFTYLNDDDLVTPALAAAGPPEAAIVYGRVDYINARGARLGRFPVEAQPSRLPALLAAGVPALTPQGTLISRRAWDVLGGFNAQLKFCGDFDFWRRGARAGLVFQHRPEPVGAFRIHGKQLSQQLAAAAAERAAVCAADRPVASRFAQAWTQASFRCRNLPLLLERRRLSGCWRSSELFVRHAS